MTNPDTAICPVCGYGYDSPSLTQERRRLASAIALQRHAARVHGLTAAEIAALAREVTT